MNYCAKLTFLSLLLMLAAGEALSQQSELVEVFNAERLRLNRSGMVVLGSWALGNMATGAIGYATTSGTTRYFHQMNVFWNTVNLTLAGVGYYTAIEGNATGLSLFETLKEQRSIEKLLLFNAGLDVGYIATGFYLRERAKSSANRQHLFEGYGNSLILQGAFLLVFDGILHWAHSHHFEQAEEFFTHLQPASSGLGLAFRF